MSEAEREEQPEADDARAVAHGQLSRSLEVLRPPVVVERDTGLRSNRLDETLNAFEQRAISKYSVPIFAAWARSEKERLDKAEARVAALDSEVRSLLETQAKDRAQIAALQSAEDTRARQRPLVLMAFLAGPVPSSRVPGTRRPRIRLLHGQVVVPPPRQMPT